MTHREGGRKTVLVVDDEAAVCESSALLLESLGFGVFTAADERSALVVLDQNQPVDLLMTDALLAGAMGGPDLARLALSRHPHIKVLLCSGRPDALIGQDFPVIGKPFTLKEIGAKLAQLLGSAEH